MIKIKKGLDLPISGTPEQTIAQGKTVRHVAVDRLRLYRDEADDGCS